LIPVVIPDSRRRLPPVVSPKRGGSIGPFTFRAHDVIWWLRGWNTVCGTTRRARFQIRSGRNRPPQTSGGSQTGNSCQQHGKTRSTEQTHSNDPPRTVLRRAVQHWRCRYAPKTRIHWNSKTNIQS